LELLTRQQAARVLSVTTGTLRKWASANAGPPFVKLTRGRSGRTRYPSDLLEEWAAAPHECTTPARPAGMPRFAAPRRRRTP